MICVDRYAGYPLSGLQSTCATTTSKNFSWTNDGSGTIAMFVDDQILSIPTNTVNKPVYGLLSEAKGVIPDVYNWVESNIDLILEFCLGVFTHDEELSNKKGFIYCLPSACSWIKNSQLPAKTKMISMITSNKSFTPGHVKRLEILEKFRSSVDLYGRGFNEIASKEEGLDEYFFSIVVENCIYPGMFSEKITDAFVTKTIPVYYGTETISKYFDMNGVIMLDDNFDIGTLSSDLYYSKMNAVNKNYEIAINLPTPEDYMAKYISGAEW